MKRILAILNMCIISGIVNADPVSGAIAEANLLNARAKGLAVYNSCILVPPVTKPQKIVCDGLLSTYEAALAVANSPLPLLSNPFPSPYMISPYDICRYEISVLIFPATGGIPICPSV